MISVQTVKLLLGFLLSTQVMAQELNSSLHSTINGVPIAYTDEAVIFTCVVRGSNSIAWTSEEYIGTGGQRLELSAAEPIGTRYYAVGNNQTVTELISATIDEIIVSQLRIRIKSNYSIASVLCHNINAGTESSTTFLLADITSIDCDRQSACPGETVTCICTTGNSNALTWMINGTRLEFASNDPPLTRLNANGLSISAVLTENSDTNGVRVIMSNITFISSKTTNILMCENVDRLTPSSVIIPAIETCSGPSDQVTTPPGNNVASTDNCDHRIAAAAVVPIIIGILACIITGVILYYQYRRHVKERERLETEKENLETDLTKVTVKLQERDKELWNKDRELEIQRGALQDKESALRDMVSKLQTKKKELDDKEKELQILKLKISN